MRLQPAPIGQTRATANSVATAISLWGRAQISGLERLRGCERWIKSLGVTPSSVRPRDPDQRYSMDVQRGAFELQVLHAQANSLPKSCAQAEYRAPNRSQPRTSL